MISQRIRILFVCLLFLSGFLSASCFAADDPLPSWNDGASKKSIMHFVQTVTNPESKSFVAPNERIAVFDNDGTLWSEHPLYFQLYFAMDRVRALAADHPEWKTEQPFQAVLEGDMKTLGSLGEKGLMQLVMATHTGMTVVEFSAIVKKWIATAEHPTLHRHYTDLVYQPMLELLDFLRAYGFKTFIVSGGGIEFMRPWAEATYGIPPEQVIGSSVVTTFAMREGKPALVREAKINFIDDKEGKPVGIQGHIGRRPLFAFGNSDGDLQMLQWTTLAGAGPRFAGIIHHTDAEREFAYDRDTPIGKLDRAIGEAEKNSWTLVDMKKDWKCVYPADKK